MENNKSCHNQVEYWENTQYTSSREKPFPQSANTATPCQISEARGLRVHGHNTSTVDASQLTIAPVSGADNGNVGGVGDADADVSMGTN